MIYENIGSLFFLTFLIKDLFISKAEREKEIIEMSTTARSGILHRWWGSEDVGIFPAFPSA